MKQGDIFDKIGQLQKDLSILDKFGRVLKILGI